MPEPADPTPRRPEQPPIRGQLTWLRPAERSDVPLFARWLSDDETLRWIARRAPLGVAQEERWFDRMLERQGGDSWFFVICLLADNRPIGSCDLHVDLDNGGAGLGIMIGETADRDRGLGTDSLNALVGFGFRELRLERIWLDVFTENARAIRSYDKAGFVREATFRHAIFRGGRHVDLHRMAILRDEWHARNPELIPSG
jgi:RimJ/RimL family protein N-acetyltransferase